MISEGKKSKFSCKFQLSSFFKRSRITSTMSNSSGNLKALPVKFDFNVTDKTLANLPDIIFGAGVFNQQYHESPEDLPVTKILERAFDLGIRALDTSSYYGPSEVILGNALQSLTAYPRDSLYLCSKAGRVAENEFDYNPASIRKSVLRSLDRLHTKYLDVIYLHDVEFVETKAALDAIGELFKLKEEGLVRHVGISGYPVDYIYEVALKVKETFGKPLDLVLSYGHFCLQNTQLLSFKSKFLGNAGLKTLVNASPLSMGLLRSQGPHSFHPASTELKQAVSKAAQYTRSQDVDLAELAIRFSFSQWSGPTVVGLSSVNEVESAVKAYWAAKSSAAEDKPLVEEVKKILGDQYNKSWDSGIAH